MSSTHFFVISGICFGFSAGILVGWAAKDTPSENKTESHASGAGGDGSIYEYDSVKGIWIRKAGTGSKDSPDVRNFGATLRKTSLRSRP